MKKSVRNETKSRIVSAAWQLFYQYGYESTTVEDIVEASHTSKGSFYYYFESKNALLGSLSYMFDEKYAELMESIDPALSPVEKLIYLNRELFLMIDNTVPAPILNELFASQLTMQADRHRRAEQDVLQGAAPDCAGGAAAGHVAGTADGDGRDQGVRRV